ncbi:hypothetical protein PGB90_005665 [Kerria lacca]
MSLVVIDNDPWLDEYELSEKLENDILDLLNKRSVELRTSDTYARLSSSVRIRLKQFETEVQQLGYKLRESTLSRSITLDESERRERLIENLRSKIIQLQRRFNDRDTMSKTNRSEQFDNRQVPVTHNKFKNSQISTWSSYDDIPVLEEDPSVMNVKQLRLVQKKMIKDQDEGLEELSKTLSRHKNIALKIGNEVDVQNEIIDDISTRVEITTTGIRSGTDQINVVSLKDSTCGKYNIRITKVIGSLSFYCLLLSSLYYLCKWFK